MRRLVTLVLAIAIASLGIASITARSAGAGGNACVNKDGSGMSGGGMGGTGGMGGMDHGMGTKSNNKRMKSGKHAMGTSCATVAGAREISVVGDAFAFSPSDITVAAGEDVTIALTADDLGHDVYVKGIGHVVHADTGDTEKGGIRIDQPGTYKFWCTVAGHKKAGMTGTLTVS